jgi:hypothetical protein
VQQLASALIAATGAILGVIVGGVISLRTQRTSLEMTTRAASHREKLSVCVAYLASIRNYRRYVMYTDVQTKEIEATEGSKGTILIEGSASYEAAANEALVRVLILADSDVISDAALALSRHLGLLLRHRVREGVGQIPDQIVLECRSQEEEFARLVRTELRDARNK